MKLGLIQKVAGLILVPTLFIISSCGNAKKVRYFPNVKDGIVPTNSPIPESVIQKNDILSINVSSLNPEASAVFNSPNSSGGPAAGGGSQIGYLVNTEGNIQFPLIGAIKAEGLTKNQLKDNIAKTLVDKKLLIDPIVTIRFVNFRVTVLGEVNHPTVVTVPNEKLSLLEALGLAGDMTIYGKRENVMIIREEKDQKLIKRINLNSDELFNSPFYYLQSNDIVYVEPSKTKVSNSSRGATLLPLILSALSLALVAVQTINNNN
jgi:polysaccharide export outer membrane protein